MASTDDRFANIKFQVIDESLDARVMDFMWEHYYPDEPVCRSLHFKRNDFLDEAHLKDALNDRSSLVALDNTGQILAVRLGKVVRKSDWGARIFEKIFVFAITYCCCCCLSQKTQWKFQAVFKLQALLQYDVFKFFNTYNCRTIYEDKAVCSARSHGVRGLAGELLKRSEELSQQRGCTHTCAITTGKYSAKVFERCGYTALKRVQYSEFRDGNGQLYLNDTREHTEAVSFIKEY